MNQKDNWASFGARPNCKLVLDLPSKMKGWKERYVFMRVPDDFLLRGTWVKNFRDPAPNFSEGKLKLVNALRLVPPYNAKFKKLMSIESLVAAGLRPPLKNRSGDVARGENEGVDNQDDLEPGMPDVNDQVSSPSRGDEFEEGDEANDLAFEQDVPSFS